MFCVLIQILLTAKCLALTPLVINASYNTPIYLTVNRSIEYIVMFEDTELSGPARVAVDSVDASAKEPLMVVVRLQKEVLSWQLPLQVDDESGGSFYNKTARTLCHDNYSNVTLSDIYIAKLNNKSLDISIKDPPIISLATSSQENITAKLFVSVEQFFIKPTVLYNVTISPSEPKYYFYEFLQNSTNKDNFETVLLEVQSDDNICMTISIQNSTCPIYDLNHDITFEGYWETVNQRGGITIPKQKFPKGFFVVFVAKGDDYDCTGVLGTSVKNRTKKFTVIIRPSITYADYANAVLITIFSIVAFYILFGIVFFFCSKSTYIPRAMEYIEDPEILNTPTTVSEPDFVDNISFDETEYDTLAEAELDNDIILGKTVVFLSDLARKDPRILKRKSYSYLWHVLTVALFYGLPVVQLVITYQRVLNDTGNQDLCYYNFLCARPWGFFSDFNHIFSNVGYILFGLLFLWITKCRETWHKDIVFDKHFGIPQHFGLFYAMGVALIMEGVLSGSYHICPNQSNFQFDTSFMYVTAVLCMVKLYQTRHPDINATAYATFGVLAIAILLGMVGILDASLFFWIAFSILHVLTCFYLSIQVYYMGCWRLNGSSLRIFRALANDFRSGFCNVIIPTFKSRMVALIIINAANLSMAAYGSYHHEKDFAIFLLGIFMMNTVLYFIFYVVMKLLHKERINMQATVFLIISLSCAAGSMYFFLRKSISWALTPAESRQFNQHCKLLKFYDYHDIWHFLSAIGMFFMFMVLLIMDDDLSHTHRSKIHVF